MITITSHLAAAIRGTGNRRRRAVRHIPHVHLSEGDFIPLQTITSNVAAGRRRADDDENNSGPSSLYPGEPEEGEEYFQQPSVSLNSQFKFTSTTSRPLLFLRARHPIPKNAVDVYYEEFEVLGCGRDDSIEIGLTLFEEEEEEGEEEEEEDDEGRRKERVLTDPDTKVVYEPDLPLRRRAKTSLSYCSDGQIKTYLPSSFTLPVLEKVQCSPFQAGDHIGVGIDFGSAKADANIFFTKNGTVLYSTATIGGVSSSSSSSSSSATTTAAASSSSSAGSSSTTTTTTTTRGTSRTMHYLFSRTSSSSSTSAATTSPTRNRARSIWSFFTGGGGAQNSSTSSAASNVSASSKRAKSTNDVPYTTATSSSTSSGFSSGWGASITRRVTTTASTSFSPFTFRSARKSSASPTGIISASSEGGRRIYCCAALSAPGDWLRHVQGPGGGDALKFNLARYLEQSTSLANPNFIPASPVPTLTTPSPPGISTSPIVVGKKESSSVLTTTTTTPQSGFSRSLLVTNELDAADRVVREFLILNGYVDTLRLMTRNPDPKVRAEDDLAIQNTFAVERKQVRELIMQGRAQTALETIRARFPGVADSPLPEGYAFAMLDLRIQVFCEAMRARDVRGALEFARAELWPVIIPPPFSETLVSPTKQLGKDAEYRKRRVREALGLFAFFPLEETTTTTMTGGGGGRKREFGVSAAPLPMRKRLLLSVERRRVVAEEVNRALISYPSRLQTFTSASTSARESGSYVHHPSTVSTRGVSVVSSPMTQSSPAARPMLDRLVLHLESVVNARRKRNGDYGVPFHI